MVKSLSFVFAMTLFLCTFSITAQTVVLINGVPTKVNLNGNEIVSIVGSAPNHMSGFPTSETQISYAEPTLEKINGAGVLDETTPALASAGSNNTPAATRPTTTTPSTTVTQSSTAPVTKANKPSAMVGNYFKFERNSALLSELAINEIKDYANKITDNVASSVKLQAFFKNGNKRSEQLVKNRLDACKKYFELNGVPASAISVEMVGDEQQSDKVSVIVQ